SPLAPADHALLDQPFEDAVRDLAGLLHGGQLALVLHRAQRLDEAAARDRLDRAGPQRLVAAVRDEIRLEADWTGQALGEILQQGALRLLELDPIDGASGLGVAEVAEQAHVLGLDEERCIRALEADEIEDVDRVGDEQRFLERLLQSPDSVVHCAAPTCSTM